MPRTRNRVMRVVRYAIFLVVLFFVVRHGWTMWRESPANPVSIHWDAVLLATFLVTVSWLPSCLAWQRLLEMTGCRAPFDRIAKAHYTGQLGKYVPGKAMALLIRGWIMRDDCGVPMRAGTLTAGYEALAFVGAGAFWAVVLAPWVFARLLRERSGLSDLQLMIASGVIAFLTLLALPVLAKLMNRLSQTMVKSVVETPPLSITGRELFRCLAVLSIGWVLQAYALVAVWQGVGGTPHWLTDFPKAMGAVTLSNVGGFVVLFAPGGLGVREWFLMQILSAEGGLNDRQVIAVALLARVTSFAGEILGAAFWQAWCRRPVRQTGQAEGSLSGPPPSV